MQGNEGKMIVQELKGIRKEIMENTTGWSLWKSPPGVAPGNRKASTGEGPIFPSLR